VRDAEFDRMGVFTYSDEEGTDAYLLGGKVAADVAAARRDQLMGVQREISERRNRELIGRTFKVLSEGRSDETDLLFQGRMESQAPQIDGVVLINELADDEVLPEEGEFVMVEITEAHQYDLVGRLV